MLRYRIGFFAFLIFSSMACINAQADTVVIQVVKQKAIITPSPAIKEQVIVPKGYGTCFVAEATWFGDVWVPERRICQYKDRSEGVAWVDGYWACIAYTQEGDCSSWDWRPGHWIKTIDIY